MFSTIFLHCASYLRNGFLPKLKTPSRFCSTDASTNRINHEMKKAGIPNELMHSGTYYTLAIWSKLAGAAFLIVGATSAIATFAVKKDITEVKNIVNALGEKFSHTLDLHVKDDEIKHLKTQVYVEQQFRNCQQKPGKSCEQPVTSKQDLKEKMKNKRHCSTDVYPKLPT